MFIFVNRCSALVALPVKNQRYALVVQHINRCSALVARWWPYPRKTSVMRWWSSARPAHHSSATLAECCPWSCASELRLSSCACCTAWLCAGKVCWSTSAGPTHMTGSGRFFSKTTSFHLGSLYIHSLLPSSFLWSQNQTLERETKP